MNKALMAGAVILVLVIGAVFWWMRPAATPDPWLGYVEGEALYIAAPISGVLTTRPAERGSTIRAGNSLFTLNPVSADADLARSAAQLAGARADLADLKQTRQRAPERAAVAARAAAARAETIRAQKEYTRMATLLARGFATNARLESVKAGLDVANANLAQAEAEIAAGQLSSGRTDQQKAGAARISESEAALRQQQQRRSEISPKAVSNGIIEQIFFNPGEWVPANTPVLALLPDDARKIRFYVPQAEITRIALGQQIRFRCDGCAHGLSATVRYIAPRTEFTPPVIYSDHARARLVFLVEASLAVTGKPLPPGLPVDVQVPVGR